MASADGLSTTLLLEEDPELGAALDEDILREARRLLAVPVAQVEPGAWDASTLAREPSLGLLVLDGLMTVNVMLGDRVASDLVGSGDVLHGSATPEELVPATLAYFANEPVRVAVLDIHFIAAARRWPALLLALHERLRVQDRRHAIANAIAKLPRVEDRIAGLLWHLAERWGRVTPDGVLLPLSLTHEAIGRLTGSARPTISLGLAELAREGAVVRRDDGGFVLHRRSLDALTVQQPRPVRGRSLAAVRTADAGSLVDAGTPRRPALVDIERVRQRIAALNEELPERTRDVETRLASSRLKTERSSELRARIAAERGGRRAG